MCCFSTFLQWWAVYSMCCMLSKVVWISTFHHPTAIHPSSLFVNPHFFFSCRFEKKIKSEGNNVSRSLLCVFGVAGSPLSMAICCDRSIAVDHFLFFPLIDDGKLFISIHWWYCDWLNGSLSVYCGNCIVACLLFN